MFLVSLYVLFLRAVEDSATTPASLRCESGPKYDYDPAMFTLAQVHFPYFR